VKIFTGNLYIDNKEQSFHVTTSTYHQLLPFGNFSYLYHVFINLQIFWYRQGDVDPKFKKLIYYNAFCITLLCICANIYFHDI